MDLLIKDPGFLQLRYLGILYISCIIHYFISENKKWFTSLRFYYKVACLIDVRLHSGWMVSVLWRVLCSDILWKLQIFRISRTYPLCLLFLLSVIPFSTSFFSYLCHGKKGKQSPSDLPTTIKMNQLKCKNWKVFVAKIFAFANRNNGRLSLKGVTGIARGGTEFQNFIAGAVAFLQLTLSTLTNAGAYFIYRVHLNTDNWTRTDFFHDNFS